MPILFTCTCGKQLRVKDELAGKRVKCPVCGEKQLVEATGPAAPVQQTRPRPDRGAGEDEAPRGKKQAQKAGGISPAVWLAIGGGAVLVVVAVVAVVLLSRSGKEAPVAKGPPTGLGARPPGQPSPAPEVAVTADQLAREFRADSQAAAKKYGNKRLLVEG